MKVHDWLYLIDQMKDEEDKLVLIQVNLENKLLGRENNLSRYQRRNKNKLLYLEHPDYRGYQEDK